MNKRLVLAIPAVIVSLGLLAAPAFGQAAQADEGPDGWTGALALYLFASSIDGTTTVGDTTAPVDVAFSTLLDALEMAFSTHGEAMRGDAGLLFDVMYVRVGNEDLATPDPDVTLQDGSFSLTDAQFAGFYRFGSAADRAGAVDVLGGARHRRLKLDLTFSSMGMTSQPMGFNEGWWDLLLGARWVIRPHERVGLVVRGDFGTTIWNVQGGVGISLSRWANLLIEYKFQRWDYDNGQPGADFFAYDADESGPLFGFGFTF